jgi:hypothetical protein
MVVDLDDPRLALYRSVRDAELLQRHGVFVAEGRLVVRRLLTESRFAARSVLVTPAARRDLGDVLDSAGRDLSVSVADADLFHALTGFHVHRGCLAIGERPVRPPDWRGRRRKNRCRPRASRQPGQCRRSISKRGRPGRRRRAAVAWLRGSAVSEINQDIDGRDADGAVCAGGAMAGGR